MLSQLCRSLNKFPAETFFWVIHEIYSNSSVIEKCNKMQSRIMFSSFYEDLFIFYLLSLNERSSLYSSCKCRLDSYKERRSGGDNRSIQSRVIIRIICGLVLWTCTALWPCSARHLRVSSFFSITPAVVKRSFAAGLPEARTLSSIRARIQPISPIIFTSESQK